MRVPYALTATAAEFTSDGRLWLLGGDFDSVGAPQFPLTMPSMTLVVKIEFEPVECGVPHRFRVELWDQDGNVAPPPLVQEFTPQRSPDFPTRPVGSNFVINLQGLSFPHPGDYAFHVLVDEHLLTSIPIYISEQ